MDKLIEELDSQEKKIIILLNDKYRDLSTDNTLKKYMDNYSKLIDQYSLEIITAGQNSESRQLLRTYKKQLKDFKSVIDRHQLFDRANDGESLEDSETDEQLMEKGLSTSNKSTQKLKDILKVTLDAKDIGVSTVEKLDKQQEQIAKSHHGLVEIDTTLSRTSKTITRIGRKIASDKVIWCFILMIVIAIAIILILKYYYHKF
jgi:hypothetical protein